MADDPIRGLLLDHPPRRGFEAELRASLESAWDEDAMGAAEAGSPRRPSISRWWSAAVAAGAVLVVAAVVLDAPGDEGEQVRSAPATSATTQGPTATIAGPSVERDVAGRRWHVIAVDDEPITTSADVWFELDLGGSVRGRDGCADYGASWAAGDDRLLVDAPSGPRDGRCGSTPRIVVESGAVVTEPGRLRIDTADGGRLDAISIAELPPPIGSDLVGAWERGTVVVRFVGGDTIELPGCRFPSWLVAGRLVVDTRRFLGDDRLACVPGDRELAQLVLDEPVVRVANGALWLQADDGDVVRLAHHDHDHADAHTHDG